MSNPLIVYSRTKSAFAEQVTSGEVDSSQVGLIGDTGEVWMGGEYRPLHCDIYVTDFTLADCDAAIANGGEMQIASQPIWDAAAANKIIFIPRGDIGGGCVALSSISDDYVYLTCIDNHIGVVYQIEVTPDGVGFIYSSRWRFLLKTINGESLLGEGDITTPTFLRIGDADDEAKANFIAVVNGEKSADYYICSSKVQGAPADGIVTILKLDGPTGSPVYVSYTFYGSPMQGGLANKLLKITTKLTVSTGAITTTCEAVLDAKQDTITDLEDIREGAAKGATALQPDDVSEFITIEDVAEVAKTGSYNDLVDTPTIKDEVYIADFYMHQLRRGEYIPFDVQALQEAIEANKIIYIPYDVNDGSQGGCVATALIEDMIYLTIFGDMGVVYLVEIDFDSTDIDPQRITERYPIESINDVQAAMHMVIRPRQRKLNVSNGQTLGLALHDYFSIVQPLSNVALRLPSVAEENNVQQCGVTFTTGTSTPSVRYIGGTIWWEGGVAPTIEANAVVEFVFTWHWQKSVWLGKCTIYKES